MARVVRAEQEERLVGMVGREGRAAVTWRVAEAGGVDGAVEAAAAAAMEVHSPTVGVWIRRKSRARLELL